MALPPSYVIGQYRTLPVALDDGSHLTVDVHRFVSKSSGFGQTERQSYLERLLAACKGDLLGLFPEEVTAVFTGAGSPDQIVRCLRLAARYKVYFHTGPAAGPGNGLVGPVGVRRVADHYIGLDAIGFVGNWARLAGLPAWSIVRPPLEWLRYGQLRAKISEVAPNDIIIWASGEHIAVISAIEPYRPPRTAGDSLLLSRSRTELRKAVVCEATLSGLQQSQYTLKFGEPKTVVAHQRPMIDNPTEKDQTSRFRVDAPTHGEDIVVHILRPQGA